MQWSGISKPAPIHTVLPSFQSQHPSGWNWSRFVCKCLKQPGIAWGYFGVRYKHREPAELIRLLLLSKPPGILRIDHSSWKPSHSSLWVFPQHVCHISCHARKRAGKGQNRTHPSSPLHLWAVGAFLCFKIYILLHLLHSKSLCLLILLVRTSRLSRDKVSLSCAPGWGRKGEREGSEGRRVCLCFWLPVWTSGLVQTSFEPFFQ